MPKFETTPQNHPQSCNQRCGSTQRSGAGRCFRKILADHGNSIHDQMTLFTGANMRALTLVIFLISFQVEADSFENSNWKVKSYRISGEEAAWSTEEAEAVNGKSVSFMKNQFKLGGQSCKVKITSATDDKRWTTGEQNPCTGEKLRGNVYILSYENCEARFPGQVALPQPGQAVAFGEGISFCLHKK